MFSIVRSPAACAPAGLLAKSGVLLYRRHASGTAGAAITVITEKGSTCVHGVPLWQPTCGGRAHSSTHSAAAASGCWGGGECSDPAAPTLLVHGDKRGAA